MSSRAKKLVNLALSFDENQAGLNNISAEPGYFATNLHCDADPVLPSDDNQADLTNISALPGCSATNLDSGVNPALTLDKNQAGLNNISALPGCSATNLDSGVNPALTLDGSQAGLNNISAELGCSATNVCSDVNMLIDTSKRYVIENRGSTKLRIRKVPENTINDETSTESPEDFSSGSSDNFEPSSGDESLSCSTESSSEEIIINQELPITSETMEHEDCSPSPKKGKKRVRKIENWASVKAKRLKNSGKCYTSRTGKVMQAKKMGPHCSEKCILACSKKVSENYRAKIFKDYWEMASLQRQRDFLGSCVEQLQLKYRRITTGVPRKPNCAFYFHINGEKTRICKTFLINTLGITERTIRTVIESRSSSTGIVVEDKRGKHGRHRKTDEEIVKSVRDHINSIPRVESHYVRKDTTREFVDGGLCIAELYRHYSSERSSAHKTAASYDMYARIFNTEYNIGFFVPRKDQCDLCESYKNSDGNEKQGLENKYTDHLQEKEWSREEKDKDKERAKNKEISLAVYDLQAVLPVPTGQTSAFFYKSRLNCYNFTVTEIGNDKSYCFFWHEGLGHRGVTEIGSCVLLYLEQLAKSKPGIDVVFYSDNCGGQQKNRYMIAAYLYAVEAYNINSITHKYLVRGHTQSEGDAVHSVIEKTVKKAKNSGPIYVPKQYVSLIRNSKKKGNPLIVKEMSFGDFSDLKALYEEIAPSLSKNVDGNEFRISDVRILQFQKRSQIFRYKLSFKQQEWDSVEFRPKKRRISEMKSIQGIVRKPAYTTKIPLTDNKKKDLKSLVENKIIPQFYKHFFDSVIS